MELQKIINKNKQIIIGIITGVSIILVFFFLLNLSKEDKAGSYESNIPSVEIPSLNLSKNWYDDYEEEINNYENLVKEASNLSEMGKTNEAIVKYSEALDVVRYNTYIGENTSDFEKFYGNLSKDEKLYKLSMFQGFGNRAAMTYYNLSFAYRDSEDVPNNMQKAIDAAKSAVDEIDKVMIAEQSEKEINPDKSLILGGLSQERKANYLSALGDLYRKYGAIDLSIKTHKQAINLNPENADIYAWYGLALYVDGQYYLGRQQWEKALELDSANADASKFLNQFPAY